MSDVSRTMRLCFVTESPDGRGDGDCIAYAKPRRMSWICPSLKSLIVILVLIPSISSQTQTESQPIEDGAWLFALKDISELRFPASMLPSSDPVLIGVTLSIDEKGRVHNTIITPADTPFSDAATKAVQKWRFMPGHRAELKAHICLGRQDDGKGIGLPCYVYGPESSATCGCFSSHRATCRSSRLLIPFFPT